MRTSSSRPALPIAGSVDDARAMPDVAQIAAALRAIAERQICLNAGHSREFGGLHE
jgi:hypothetical protein